MSRKDAGNILKRSDERYQEMRMKRIEQGKEAPLALSREFPAPQLPLYYYPTPLTTFQPKSPTAKQKELTEMLTEWNKRHEASYTERGEWFWYFISQYRNLLERTEISFRASLCAGKRVEQVARFSIEQGVYERAVRNEILSDEKTSFHRIEMANRYEESVIKIMLLEACARNELIAEMETQNTRVLMQANEAKQRITINAERLQKIVPLYRTYQVAQLFLLQTIASTVLRKIENQERLAIKAEKEMSELPAKETIFRLDQMGEYEQSLLYITGTFFSSIEKIARDRLLLEENTQVTELRNRNANLLLSIFGDSFVTSQQRTQVIKKRTDGIREMCESYTQNGLETKKTLIQEALALLDDKSDHHYNIRLQMELIFFLCDSILDPKSCAPIDILCLFFNVKYMVDNQEDYKTKRTMQKLCADEKKAISLVLKNENSLFKLLGRLNKANCPVMGSSKLSVSINQYVELLMRIYIDIQSTRLEIEIYNQQTNNKTLLICIASAISAIKSIIDCIFEKFVMNVGVSDSIKFLSEYHLMSDQEFAVRVGDYEQHIQALLNAAPQTSKNPTMLHTSSFSSLVDDLRKKYTILTKESTKPVFLVPK